jgi:P27 family predicted phage terminase small subunit
MKPRKVEVVPKAPEYLGPKGRELWFSQLTQLVALGMLTEVDLNILGQYCKQWDIWTDAEQSLRDNGYKNKHDQVSADVTVLYKAEASMLKIADRFGFTASARMKLELPEEKQEDPLSEHLKKRKN